MNKLLLASLVAPTLLLGGCMGTENRGIESVHQPVVGRADYALDLATRGTALAPGESRRLAGWMNVLHLGFGDKVAIDDPGYDSVRARDEVAGVVASYGLLLSDDSPITTAPVTAGTIRVIVSRMRAGTPGCPDWSRMANTEYDSNTSSNFGCSINANLAAMVARPEDLVHGRSGDTYIDTATSAKAIDAYRKAAPTGNGNTVKTESAKGS